MFTSERSVAPWRCTKLVNPKRKLNTASRGAFIVRWLRGNCVEGAPDKIHRRQWRLLIAKDTTSSKKMVLVRKTFLPQRAFAGKTKEWSRNLWLRSGEGLGTHFQSLECGHTAGRAILFGCAKRASMEGTLKRLFLSQIWLSLEGEHFCYFVSINYAPS